MDNKKIEQEKEMIRNLQESVNKMKQEIYEQEKLLSELVNIDEAEENEKKETE